MSDPIRITSRANARVRQLLKLRTQRGRRESGRFVAEGLREVDRALGAGLSLHELYICPPVLGADARSIEQALPRLGSWREHSIRVFEVSDRVFPKVTYRERSEGVLGVFEQPSWRLEQLAASAARPDLWLVSVGATKPGNMGAMARSALAAGASGMLLADTIVDAMNPNAIRASTGAVFTLPLVRAPSVELVDFLRGRGVQIVAADPFAEATYNDLDLTAHTALVIGAEDRGLAEPWLSAASGHLVRIPMAAESVDSLNAAVVAAVLLFEAIRQRSAADGTLTK